MSDKFNYTNGIFPDSYVCSNCGKKHIKLWRIYQSLCPDLLCAECAAINQKKDISTMDKNGVCSEELGKTDTIGWYIPAVPDEEGLGYWGYTSVPDNGIKWWQSLPNK